MKLARVPPLSRAYIESEIDYELAPMKPGEVRRLCHCDRDTCRSVRCLLCWREVLAELEGRHETHRD